MTKPTREHVEKMIQCSPFAFDKEDVRLDFVSVLKAYLAQEEELEVVELEKHTMCEAWEKQNKIIEQLKADNQALKTKGEQLCCRVGVLEMENQEWRNANAYLHDQLDKAVNT